MCPHERPLGGGRTLLQEARVAAQLLPPRFEQDGTLRRIYEEALARFAVRGYHGVSVRDIADACGITASSIYAHVPSKEQLLYDLILMGHEEHRDHLRAALLSAGSEPADQLRDLVAGHVRFHAAYPVLATVCNNELHALSEDSASAVQAIRDEGVRIFTGVIERGRALGRFHCDDPLLVTAAIAAMGIRVAAWYRPEAADASEEISDRYAARVWQLFALLGKSYSADDIAQRYAEFALKMLA